MSAATRQTAVEVYEWQIGLTEAYCCMSASSGRFANSTVSAENDTQSLTAERPLLADVLQTA